MKNKRASGFTLTELFVVMAVIAILSALAYAALGPADDKMQAVQIIEDMRTAKTALMSYYTKNGKWPDSDANNKKADEILGAFLDKKLGDNVLISVTQSTQGKNDGIVKAGSVFVKYDLKNCSAKVKDKLAEDAEKNDLWNSTFYGSGSGYNSKYYIGSGKTGENTAHMVVSWIK